MTIAAADDAEKADNSWMAFPEAQPGMAEEPVPAAEVTGSVSSQIHLCV